MDLAPLEGRASEKLLATLNKLNAQEGTVIKEGLDELTFSTKRSDDVSDCMDVLLKQGLLSHITSFLEPGVIQKYEGEATVRGFAAQPITIGLGEAVQLAACAALGGSRHVRMEMEGGRGAVQHEA